MSVLNLYCLLVLPHGEGGSMMARIDWNLIQISSGSLGILKVASDFRDASINEMYASPSALSTSRTFPTYHFLSYAAATQSPIVGVTKSFSEE